MASAPSARRSAATGASQPPATGPTHPRAPSPPGRVSASSTGAPRAASPARTWSATAPWPASGTSSAGSKRRPISWASPRRSSPAAASTIASSPRSRRLRSRVSTFPRSGSIESDGSSASSCARRRTDAVPIRIPGATAAAPQSASRGSSRGRYAPTSSPAVSVEVMSFAEWTATSTRPARSASSSSFTNTPRAPISPNGRVRSRSPAVVIGTSASSRSARTRRRASAASCACTSASRLPREPSRTSIATHDLSSPRSNR